jgi:hypothetical protein
MCNIHHLSLSPKGKLRLTLMLFSLNALILWACIHMVKHGGCAIKLRVTLLSYNQSHNNYNGP